MSYLPSRPVVLVEDVVASLALPLRFEIQADYFAHFCALIGLLTSFSVIQLILVELSRGRNDFDIPRPKDTILGKSGSGAEAKAIVLRKPKEQLWCALCGVTNQSGYTDELVSEFINTRLKLCC